ncbi:MULTISPECIES: bifunctional 3-phosphoshikimate 1-carboxyvinyltransferase/cytidylate kinase [Ramlibacter]|uniref:Multifunctional fusion protein n=1 Tax=Ramlibacter pinisoli TaxID=2682844 RepID=A0A6N8IS78_9BURK|nr:MULTISPECIES: bifunctional 3-phosphoshikimate 1-carboxyvinyltransferase/cytidylate kinase [Ramlibacter]MBA2963970.1 bifunctional 3-phosphoshikimate 1-carboxyvinyltransferase/cytidylate kinase [Ramlibacter sp. CGMCC 1.13660]MVQ28936.1 bifunctional 3-phosphoshikimate 1-carboxyvinyltransferase/cytidylate kinase [Ramlibacter pinisoli]
MFSTDFLDIPALEAAGGEVALPGSKSISNRVLLLAALCDGTTTVHDLLDSDDTRVMLDALRALGCGVVHRGAAVEITGFGARGPVRQARLFLGNAGTAMRPLAAALAVLGGDFELSGVPRMHERPIGDLVDALRQLGCRIDYLGQPGFPPLRLGTPDLRLDQPIPVRGDVSSQFLTALLMALPLAAQRNIVIEVVGELISKPYIEITLNLLARFSIAVQREGWRRFTIPAGSSYRSPGEVHVEADASSASYFAALGAIARPSVPGRGIRILGVGSQSIQGDIRFLEAAEAMGARVTSGPNWVEVARGAWPLKAVDLDCNHIPDAAMTLAVMALYADGPTTLRNIASWRVKETDRLAAMAAELRKLGATVEEGTDFLRVTPPARWGAAAIRTYDDHRVAMCFSLAAFNPDGVPVRILDPQCVAKTFPDYFETLFGVASTATARVPVICVDGPTASGKGTLAAETANRLGYHYLDSGALYRITALAALRAGLALDTAHEPAIATLAATLPVRFHAGRVLLAGQDVTEAIRTEEAGMNASRVSALPAVRAALVDLQQSFRRLPGLVADGRDMGTVIFPDAPMKVFLTASAARRAERRHKQLISKGNPVTLDALRADLEARDARDSQRAVAPLKPAQDALLLDNSEQSVEDSVAQVLAWWQARQPFAAA